jgi:rhodanese-related sulfurtransferase
MNISQQEWVEQFEDDNNALILDVRTEDEWSEGIIPNAILIDINKGQDFIHQIEELDKSKNYYVYCRSGARSAKACEIMNELGIDITYNLVGGFMQWEGDIVIP